MLSIQDVHTYYGDSYILQGVSMELQPGQVVALLGRNGVGKTTLARSIMGLTPARSGRILFADQDITRMSAHRIARLGLGYVPQGRQVFRSLTIKEHLEVTARGQGQWSLERILDRIEQPGGAQIVTHARGSAAAALAESLAPP